MHWMGLPTTITQILQRQRLGVEAKNNNHKNKNKKMTRTSRAYTLLTLGVRLCRKQKTSYGDVIEIEDRACFTLAGDMQH